MSYLYKSTHTHITWYIRFIIQYPLTSIHTHTGGGWLYTWGSGYYGQLAHGAKVVIFTPELVEYFLSVHLLIKSISAGTTHCACLTKEEELYTWGSNTNNCLGRFVCCNGLMVVCCFMCFSVFLWTCIYGSVFLEMFWWYRCVLVWMGFYF